MAIHLKFILRRCLRLAAIFIFLLAACLPASSSSRAEEPTPTLEVPVLAAAPVLDGKLDETAWEQAAKFDKFLVVNAPERQPPARTEVRLLAADGFLWIGFHCEDPSPATLKADTTAVNGPVWDDDAVELFIAPPHRFVSLVQVIVNCRGVTFQNGSGPVYSRTGNEFGLEAKAQVGRDFWSVELRLPLDRIGLSLPALRRGDCDVFGMNFARDLRNPAFGEKLNLCPSKLAYFDRAGFQKLRFAGPAPELVVRGDSDDLIHNQLGIKLSLKNPSAQSRKMWSSWTVLSDDDRPIVPAPQTPEEISLAAGQTVETEFALGDLAGGERIVTWKVSADPAGMKTLWVRQFVMELDPPVIIAPDFPAVSPSAPGPRQFRMLIAPYLLGGDGDKPGWLLEVLACPPGAEPDFRKEIAPLAATIPISIPVRNPPDAWQTDVRAILKWQGRIAAEARYAYSTRTTVASADRCRSVVANWGFEEETDQRPRLWREDDPHTQASRYPRDWGMWKQAAWWAWGDLQKIPRSVYEGRRSVVLQGYGPGAQLHFGGAFFKIDRSATYHLSLVARGKGKMSVRYYVRNKNGQWMNRYFDSRIIELTDDWTRYEFDPVCFDQPIAAGWDGSILPADDNLPDNACPVVWIHDDGFACLDNVILLEESR